MPASGCGPASDDRAPAAEVPILPGEDVESVDPEDVEHWVAVYEELLEAIYRARPMGDIEADAPVQRTARRFALRRNYWRRRSG